MGRDSNNPQETQEIAPYRTLRGTQVVQADQLPNNEASQDDLLSNAQRSIQASRSTIAKLIDATPLDDHYTLERLGPILCELRTAESILRDLEPPYNA